MKILLAVHGFPPENVGGTELYVQRLARGLQERGHEVVVVSGTLRYEKEEPRKHAFDEGGLRGYWLLRADLYFDSWEKSYCARTGRLFQEIVREEQPDIVHVHHWVRTTRDLVHRAFLEGVPSVVTLHDLWSTCLVCFRVKDHDLSFCTAELDASNCIPCVGTPEWFGESEGQRVVDLLRADMRNELALARRVVVPSRSQGELIERVMGVAGRGFEVVPHGAPRMLARGDLDGGSPGSDRKLRIACWSHLHAYKGQHVLLEALLRMKHREQVEVRLLGDCWKPEYRDRLDALVSDLDVTFVGAFGPSDLESLRADLCVFPTLCHESYSFVVDEARLLGIPIVATDLGALRERVPPGGALFARGDAGALAAILDGIVENPAQLEEWRSAITPPADFDHNVEAIARLYEEVVAEGLAGVEDTFDAREHEEFEAYRSEQRHRHLLRYSGLKDHVANLEQQNEALRHRLRDFEAPPETSG